MSATTSSEKLSDAELRAVVVAAINQVAPEADTARLAPSAPLREQLDIDSFDFLQILVALDARLHVSVPERDYGKVGTLDELVRYLQERLP